MTGARRNLLQVTLAGALAATVLGAPPALAQWVPPYWVIDRAGLTDADHTSLHGAQLSDVRGLNNAGQVIGLSSRYQGTDTSFYNQSAWLYTPGQGTQRLGFFDPAHTTSDGRQYSWALGLNNAGQVTGTSERYVGGGSYADQSAWIYDPATGVTTRLGLLDSEHTSNTGAQSSSVVAPNQAGQCAGESVTYNNATNIGSSAWFYSPGAGSVRVGFYDAVHTGPDNRHVTQMDRLNEAGQVTGWSARWLGSSSAGNSAWIYTPGSGETRVGLIDAEHTRADGGQNSLTDSLNDAGYVTGDSTRYQGGSSSLGTSTWLYVPGTGTTRIGFHDAQHTRADGRQESKTSHFDLNSAGQVVGYSTRYSGSANVGRSAWLHTPGTGTVRIGLTDAAHTRASDGFQYSRTEEMGVDPDLHPLNSAGQVIGSSERVLGEAYGGETAWMYDAAHGTVATGLTDAVHTASSGLQYGQPLKLSESGLAVGYSRRYSGNTQIGQSGWFFDMDSGVTTPLVFSTRSDGFALTTPTVLTESGWVLGSYNLYSGSTLLGANGFLWSLDKGFTDLGGLVNGGLSSFGWSVLSSVSAANEFTTIVGQGKLIGMSTSSSVQAVYVMTIPAPPAAAGFALLACAALRRRRA